MPAKYREVEINDLRLIALNTENIYLTEEKQTDGTATTAITGVLPHAKLGRFSGHLSIYHTLIKNSSQIYATNVYCSKECALF